MEKDKSFMMMKAKVNKIAGNFLFFIFISKKRRRIVPICRFCFTVRFLGVPLYQFGVRGVTVLVLTVVSLGIKGLTLKGSSPYLRPYHFVV